MPHDLARRFLLVAIGCLILAPTTGLAQPSAPFEAALQMGQTAEAERLLTARLAEQANDDNSRFALGIVQFLRAVEGRMQAFHRHGFRVQGNDLIGLTNLPIPPNPKPEPLDYPTARKLLQRWLDDLVMVDTTLAKIKTHDVKVPIHFGLIKLDFNGDGRSGDDETFWTIYSRYNQRAGASAEGAKSFVVALDRGDVDWLRGYCHLLAALTETLLAHDFEALFNNSCFLVFSGVKPPHDFLVKSGNGKDPDMVGMITDYIALIHQIHLPVVEPARLNATRGHLEAMITLSRSSWQFILAETDDDREWLPNPKQNTVVPNGKMTEEMIATWTNCLDEFEAILAGKKLIPFWRGDNPRLGVNLRRVLTEPRPFDLVFWAQGTAAAPYLEEGDVTSPSTWARFNRIFRGEFLGFAFWIN